MDSSISREEHEEFKKRLDDENHRQNRRIEVLEESVRQMGVLTTSVEKLATNMENMAKEQEKQGKRLELLEVRDEMSEISLTMERINASMENAVKIQEQHGERLEELEGRDGEKWRAAAGYVLTAVLGIVIGFVFKQIGM